MPTGWLGMKGTGTFDSADSALRPKNWRQMLLRLYPNGDAPMTAILSMMREERTDDPEFNWWTKALPVQGGAVLSKTLDNIGVTPYTSGGAVNDSIWIGVSATVASEFRLGHQVLLQDLSDPRVDVNAKVVGKNTVASTVYLECRLLEADDNSPDHDLSDCDYISVIGNINPEGAPMPDSIAYFPTKYRNLTQIFRTSLDITRTAKQTRLRTEANYEEMKREALEIHGQEMEKAFIWSVMTEGIGDNGQPERTMNGILPFIKANAPQNVSDFTLDTDFAGKDWTETGGGKTWLNEQLEQIFSFGKEEKLALVGNGTLGAINALVEANSTYNISYKEKAYGIMVYEWMTPQGIIYLKRHPLFALQSKMRNAMLILEPRNLIYRYIQDTMFKPDDRWNKGGRPAYDAISEEYLTECSLEMHHPQTFGYLTGVGLDNELSP